MSKKQTTWPIWFKNIFASRISRLNRREKDLWIFGAWLGDRYADNAKYMYEYVKKNAPEVRAVWVSPNEGLVTELRANGLDAEYAGSREGILLQKKAGVMLYTNSVNDFGDKALAYGALKIALWHGMPLKRFYSDDNAHIRVSPGFTKAMYRVKWALFNNVGRDITIASSPSAKRCLASAFILDPNRVHVTGQPRDDIFIDDHKCEAARKKLMETYGASRVILYLPTYRSTPALDAGLHAVLSALSADEDFGRMLEDTDSVMLIKTHLMEEIGGTQATPREGRADIDSGAGQRVFFLTDEKAGDVQELLAGADVFVTDYSSAFTDFALTGRPIVFYAEDHRSYEETENGFYYNYIELTEGALAKSRTELAAIIKRAIYEPDAFADVTRRLNAEFNTAKPEASFSENVYNVIKEKLGW